MKKNLKATIDNINFFDALLVLGTGNTVSVRLLFYDYDSGIIGGRDYYSAMRTLHEELDKKGVKLLCNCFRFDVRPSNMSIDMGGGIKAYKLNLGESATELVDIFAPTDDLASIVTVEEQRDFYLRWLKSLK